MKCPIDQTELSKQKYESHVEIDECGVCHGIWLDKGELENIQDLEINNYEDRLRMLPDYVGNAFSQAVAKTKPVIKCLVCNGEMERREYAYCSQILVDTCIKGHGVWLDADELRALEIFYERVSKDDDMKKGFLVGLLDSLK